MMDYDFSELKFVRSLGIGYKWWILNGFVYGRTSWCQICMIVRQNGWLHKYGVWPKIP